MAELVCASNKSLFIALPSVLSKNDFVPLFFKPTLDELGNLFVIFHYKNLNSFTPFCGVFSQIVLFLL